LQLCADQCWRLGMIVFELINNAARHAFPGREGEIRVELLRAGAFAKCSVTDNGSAALTVRPGRGLKIIDELSKSLGGRCIQKFEPRGSRSILAFPCHGEFLRSSRKERFEFQNALRKRWAKPRARCPADARRSDYRSAALRERGGARSQVRRSTRASRAACAGAPGATPPRRMPYLSRR
jgi:hypothetical protein